MPLIQYAIKQHQHLFAYIQLGVNDVDEATQDNNEIKNVPGIAKIILQEKKIIMKMNFLITKCTVKLTLNRKAANFNRNSNAKTLVKI
jgi:hypothetical protein